MRPEADFLHTECGHSTCPRCRGGAARRGRGRDSSSSGAGCGGAAGQQRRARRSVARGPLLPALPAAIETPEARLLELGCRVGLPLAVWLLVLSTGCLTAANALTPTWVSTRVTPVYRHSCSHVQWLTLVLTLLTPVYVT